MYRYMSFSPSHLSVHVMFSSDSSAYTSFSPSHLGAHSILTGDSSEYV